MPTWSCSADGKRRLFFTLYPLIPCPPPQRVALIPRLAALRTCHASGIQLFTERLYGKKSDHTVPFRSWHKSMHRTLKEPPVLILTTLSPKLLAVLHKIQYLHCFLQRCVWHWSQNQSSLWTRQISVTDIHTGIQINHLAYICRKHPWIYGNSCWDKWIVR